MLTAYNKLTDKVFPSDRPLGYRTGTYAPVVLLTHQHQSASNFLFRPAGQARQSFAVIRAWNLPGVVVVFPITFPLEGCNTHYTTSA